MNIYHFLHRADKSMRLFRIHTFPLVFLFLVILLFTLSGCNAPQNTTEITKTTPTEAPTAITIPEDTSAAQTEQTSITRNVLIDTDMAGDDWMAILYLLQKPDITVKAITVVGTGEAHCDPGVDNATRLVALAGSDPIPAACGRETPLQGNRTFPVDWRTYVDGMAGISTPGGTNPNTGMGAVELLTSTLQQSSDKMTLLTLGPLTNIAEMIQNTPSIVDKIEMIYVMGGSVDAPGNIAVSTSSIDNDTAEWNIYIDPYAANIVFGSGAPVTMVGLDATNTLPVNWDFYNKLKENQNTPEARFVLDYYDKNQWSFDSNSLFFWDQATAAVLSDESITSYKEQPVCVIEEEGSQSGRTVVDENCPVIRVAQGIDQSAFMSLFLDTLNGR